jgi:hypothetical protein
MTYARLSHPYFTTPRQEQHEAGRAEQARLIQPEAKPFRPERGRVFTVTREA